MRDVLGKIRGVAKNNDVLLLCMIGLLVFFGNIAPMTFLSDTLKISVSEDKIGILLSRLQSWILEVQQHLPRLTR